MLARLQQYQSIFEVNPHPLIWLHSTSLPTTWTGLGRDQGISVGIQISHFVTWEYLSVFSRDCAHPALIHKAQ